MRNRSHSHSVAGSSCNQGSCQSLGPILGLRGEWGIRVRFLQLHSSLCASDLTEAWLETVLDDLIKTEGERQDTNNLHFSYNQKHIELLK